MAKKGKKRKPLPLKNLFIVLALIGGVVIGYVLSHFSVFSVDLIEPSVNQVSPEGTGTIACTIPKGSYQVGVSGDGNLNWKVVCDGKTINSGRLHLNDSISLGQANLPAIKKGSRVTGSTTLAALCSPIKAEGYSQICEVCKLVNCKQIKLSANLTVTDTSCQQPPTHTYTAPGNGSVTISGKFSYSRSNCSASGTARGKFNLDLESLGVIAL